ncbi:MAG: hypothetical protein AAF378_01335, partial [Cyanobacteria bacterium P01_A01_bin.84]
MFRQQCLRYIYANLGENVPSWAFCTLRTFFEPGTTLFHSKQSNIISNIKYQKLKKRLRCNS